MKLLLVAGATVATVAASLTVPVHQPLTAVAAPASVSFASPVNLPPPGDGGFTATAIGDLNGDGRADLIAVTQTILNGDFAAAVDYYPQTSAGKLGPVQHATGAGFAYSTGRVVIADLYGDGHKEVLIGTLAGVDVYSVTNGKLAATPKKIAIAQPVSDLAVANVAGDSHPDLIVSPDDAQTFTIYQGSAAHTFTAQHTFTFPLPALTQGVPSIWPADFNGDGRTDIAFYNIDEVDVVLRTATGGWTTAPGYPGVADVHNAIVGDFTGDGKPDLVLSYPDLDPGSLFFFKGTGNGSFPTPVTYSVAKQPGSMAGSDLNRDGRLDLVVGHFYGDELGVLLQKSNGTFAAESLVPAPGCCDEGPDQPAVGDLNGDGKPDVAVGSTAHGVVVLYQK